MKHLFVLVALGLASLTACGGDDNGGGSGGSSTGGTGGSSTGGSGGSSTGGSAGSGGSSTGGSAGSGGSSTGGSAGSGGSSTGGTGGSSTGGTGGSSTGGTGGSSTGGTGGSSTGGTGGTSACNTLVNDGGDIPEVAQTGTPPTMTGGNIADGTWVLTGRKDWQGSCNCTTRQKLTVAASAMQLVTRTDSKPDQHMSATATLAGNKLTLAVSCPASVKQDLTYTATATELQVYDPADKSLNIYTKK